MTKSSLNYAKLFKTYQGFPQGMPTTQADAISADLLAFVQC